MNKRNQFFQALPIKVFIAPLLNPRVLIFVSDLLARKICRFIFHIEISIFSVKLHEISF